MELSFVARSFRVLVGVAVFALILMNEAEDRLTPIFSSLPDLPTSIEAAETVAVLSRLFAIAELARPMVAVTFAAATMGVALAIAGGARRQGSISLLFLGAVVPTLLYVIAPKSMG